MADTDRELLERAAKAAGINVWTDIDGNYYSAGVGMAETPWNPLTDDGDALRLAVSTNVIYAMHSAVCDLLAHDGEQPSKEQTIRRAIVRAAAAMGGGNG